MPPGSHCCFVPTVQCSICLLFIFSTVSRLMLLPSCNCNSSFLFRRILFFTPRGCPVAFSTRVNLCVTHNFYPAPFKTLFRRFRPFFQCLRSNARFVQGTPSFNFLIEILGAFHSKKFRFEFSETSSSKWNSIFRKKGQPREKVCPNFRKFITENFRSI